MIKRNLLSFSVLLIGISLCLIVGCSDDSSPIDLTGQWQGQNTNETTGKSWPFSLYIEDYPDVLTGIYSDAHRTVSIRNITYEKNQFGFIIDLYPETVTFFGKLDGHNSMSGTWSYSGDSNNGTWYIYRVTSGFDDTTPEPEATPSENQSNPFSH